jgi:hypothetical protein
MDRENFRATANATSKRAITAPLTAIDATDMLKGFL